MSIDLLNSPVYNNYGLPNTGNTTNFSGNHTNPDVIQYETTTPAPTINTGNGIMPKFTVSDSGTGLTIPIEDVPVKKERRRKPKKESGEIVRASKKKNNEPISPIEIVDTPTEYSYMETTNLLKDTLGQIDTLNLELMQEFEYVRHSRTIKNKYNTLVGLSENVGSLINARISAIREINNSISKSNDLDYKKQKDLNNAKAAENDDKYIADLYKSYIQNPVNVAPNPQLPQVDASIFGSGIVRADIRGDINQNGPVDAGYLNYLSNLSPEQNMMRYEDNPNVKQVVVFDAESGNKFFQIMDVSTGTVIPNVPVYDQMFMEDTTLDLKNKIAKNINLNETFPIVIINEGVKSQY